MLEYLQIHQNELNKHTPIERPLLSTSLFGTDVVVEENRQLVDQIAGHVLYGKN